MLSSVMLWMPSWGGMVNGLLTLRGAWHKVVEEPVLKFFVVAITAYGMATFEGPMLSIKSVNALAHYTDWIIAHVHTGALGWNGFLTFGMVYWLLPRRFRGGPVLGGAVRPPALRRRDLLGRRDPGAHVACVRRDGPARLPRFRRDGHEAHADVLDAGGGGRPCHSPPHVGLRLTF